MKDETFTLTEDHIKLLSFSWTSWDHCEFGAACIDPKRPYGNGDVLYDMYEIIFGVPPEEDEDEEKVISEEDEAFLLRLHAETETALQILLNNPSGVQPGVYTRKQYGCSPWRLTS